MELRCYAYRRGEMWEAICVDFDVATFGNTLEQAARGLRDAVDLHFEAVQELPTEERDAMLARRSPWHLRVRLRLLSCLHGLCSCEGFPLALPG